MTEPARATNSETSTPADPRNAVQEPAEDLIRLRAYELYEKRDGAPGDADGDWYQAEAELKGTSERTR
jgi:hypothetical protein